MAVADAATTTLDVVVDAARTTLVPARHQRVDSALLLATMCLTMDTRQPQIRCKTSWEKLVQYIGTNYYGQDISNELQNKASYCEQFLLNPCILLQ